MKELHNLLRRQLKRTSVDQNSLPEEWQALLNTVNNAYHEFDIDRQMLERSLDLSSQELVQANSEMQAIFQAIPDLLFRLDNRDIVIDYKTGGISNFFLSPQEMIGKNIQDIPLKNVGRVLVETIRKTKEEKKPITIEYSLTVEEQEYTFEARILPLMNEHVVIILRDITSRRRMEQAVIESEFLFRTLVENQGEGCAIVDPIEKFVFANQSAEEIFGVPHGELVGKNLDQFTEAKQFEFIQSQTVQRRTGEKGHYELEIKRPDGEKRILEVTTTQSLDHTGQFVGVIGIFSDITSRKHAEEEIRRLNAELENRVAERTAQLEASMKELSDFSYSVSHDLRSPLRGIDGLTLAVLEDYSVHLEEQGKYLLHRVRRASQRMGELIDCMQSLAYITRSEMHRSAIDLSRLGEDILSRLHETEPFRQVRWIIEPGLIIHADPNLLRIMMENLLKNAWKFTSTHATATIEIGSRTSEVGTSYFVRDDGVGFDMRYAGKLFGDFQRLHTQTEFAGMGVGLATVRRIMHRHGGRVWAEGTVEKGAKVSFTFQDVEKT